MSVFFDGQASEVIRAMREKARLVAAGLSTDHIRPMLIICGGVMKGAYGGGAVTAIHEAKMERAFDVVATFSTGTPTGAYFLGGSPRMGATIYSEECCTRSFFNPWRLGNICDTEYLVNVFRSGRKRLDTAVILNHRHQTKWVIGVTDYVTAEQRLLSPITEEEIFTLLQASISVPGLSTHRVWVGGHRLVDGSYSDPLPIARLVAEHHPTHMVVLANRERRLADKTPFLERVLNATVFRPCMTTALRKAAGERRTVLSERFRELLSSDPAPKIPTLISWGDA